MSEAALFDQYRSLWAARYGVPCSLILSALDYMKLGTHLQAGLQSAQLATALDGYFETDDPLVLKRRHPLGLFLVNPMQYAVTDRPPRRWNGQPRYEPWICPHEQPCSNRGMCETATLLGRPER